MEGYYCKKSVRNFGTIVKLGMSVSYTLTVLFCTIHNQVIADSDKQNIQQNIFFNYLNKLLC